MPQKAGLAVLGQPRLAREGPGLGLGRGWSRGAGGEGRTVEARQGGGQEGRSSVEEVTATRTGQHRHIKTLMETVAAHEGSDRQVAFAELCRFLAAHEAAEEECIHSPAKAELDGDTTVVDRRIEEEDAAGKAIAELERLGTESPAFRDHFEKFRQAVVSHAEPRSMKSLLTSRGLPTRAA